MLTKFSEKLLLTSTLWLVLSFLGNTLSAQCPAVTNIQKDSTTLTHVHFSWTGSPGVLQYHVRYVTPSDTFTTITPSPSVAFPIPSNQAFEQISVTPECGSGLKGGTVTATIGGVVITIVDIFTKTSGCDSSVFEDDYLFFEDQCKYCKISDLCAVMAALGGQQSHTAEEWLNLILNELNSDPERYNWFSWKEDPRCADTHEEPGNDPPGVRRGTTLSDIAVFPNPFSQQCIIRLGNAGKGSCDMKVCDMQGRVIAEEQLKLDGSTRELRLQVAGQLAPGIYMLRMKLNGESRNIRIVKR